MEISLVEDDTYITQTDVSNSLWGRRTCECRDEAVGIHLADADRKKTEMINEMTEATQVNVWKQCDTFQEMDQTISTRSRICQAASVGDN